MGKKVKPQMITAKKSAKPRRFIGRKSRTPVLFSPSAKGSGRPALQPGVKLESKGTANRSELLKNIRISALQQEELRDIGELSFGQRKTPSPGVLTPKSANNIADRARVTNVADPPWRKVSDLLITAGDGTRHSGTAWFISPRTLVTAGHCVSVFRPGSPAHGMVRSILVMPARNGETSASNSPFGWVEVPRQNLQVHSRWANNGDLGFDYGAIILPQKVPPLGEQTGFFGYGHFLDQDLDESRPTLSGYPDNVPEGTQWFEVNLIKEITTGRVFYDIFTFAGQSGSPVFFRNNNRQIACAIHTFGDVSLNSGVRINPQVIAQLNAWKV
jgi:glutamyl endopeptidase